MGRVLTNVARPLFRLLVVAVLVGLVALYVLDSWRPDVLAVGNVTIDVLGSHSGLTAPGGAVTYAAAVAKGLHRRVCVATTAAQAEHVAALAGHDVHVIPSAATLTFEHTYTWFGNHRRLRVTAHPDVALTAAHVPLRCRLARIVLVGPLTQMDVDVASFTHPRQPFFRWFQRAQHIGVMGQGYQRGIKPDGLVHHLKHPSVHLLAALAPHVSLFLSDVETDPWSRASFDGVVARVRALVVTRGEKGVSVYLQGRDALHIPARAIKPLDTNGAGDTFATTYMLAIAEGSSVQDAGMRATWAASRVCLQPQACKPACCVDAVREGDWVAAQPKPVSDMPRLFRDATKRGAG